MGRVRVATTGRNLDVPEKRKSAETGGAFAEPWGRSRLRLKKGRGWYPPPRRMEEAEEDLRLDGEST